MTRLSFFGAPPMLVGWVLLLAGFATALSRAQVPELESELERIDRLQRTTAWFESQPQIDGLRQRMSEASVNQRARLELMDGTNRLLAGEFGQALASADDVLGRPVQPPLRLQAWRLGAAALSALQRYARAFEYVAEALRLADRIDSAADRAGVHALAARMHAEAGESALGLQYAAEALQLAERSGDPAVICDAWVSLLHAQIEAGMIEPALEGTQALWQRCQQAGDPERVAYSLGVIGRVHLVDGNYPAAIGWLERGLEAQREARMQTGRIDNELALARAYLADGRPAAARTRLDAVLSNLRDSDRVADQARTRLLMSDVLAGLGEHGAALDQLDEYRHLPEQAEQQRRDRQLAYLQVEFENQRRVQQVELLRRQQRIADQEQRNRIARERLGRWGIGLGALVLALMGGLLLKLRIERRRLKRLARVDGLTGVLNHRAFHDAVAGDLDANRGENRNSGRGRGTLIAADVDLFKRINDRYGHQAGDAVLRALGATLREQFPPPCVVGRVGGEEFAIWLPDNNRLQARQRIGALRQALRPVEFRGQPISCTLSFGLIEVRGEVRLEHLRIQADRALYRAKRAGRDEIVDAGDLVSSAY